MLVLFLPVGCMAQTSSVPPPTMSAAGATASDPALNTLLNQLRDTAMRSESDVARLQIDRWKTDTSTRQQAQSASDSIRRNLNYAVPELIEKLRAAPGSLGANFRLYRNMNALYDTFSLLVANAGAFAAKDAAGALEADLTQIDNLRRQLAERNEQIAVSSDAELARARTRPPAAVPAKAPTRIVVDDNSAPVRKAKPAQSTQH